MEKEELLKQILENQIVILGLLKTHPILPWIAEEAIKVIEKTEEILGKE